MIPGSVTPLLLKSAAAGGLQIERSLRFNSSDSAYLSRTPGTAGNRNLWTLAFWIKRCKFGTAQDVFSVGTSGTDILYFDSSDRLCLDRPGATVLVTTQVFRDPSAWYHIALRIDSTNGTNANKAQLYVNGSEVTTFSTDNRSGLTSSSFLTNTVILHTFGIRSSNTSTNPCDIYLANIHFIDGQALDPSSFTETDATTGQLIPKTYTGSYGTNGFNLLFADNSSNTASTLGKDTSGNGNNWTPNNLSINTGGPTSVAAASGALPVFNTTDTYGAVKGTGTRTDSNASSLVLAIPMDGANNGTTFTDESATIRGSGTAKAITSFGDTKTLTAQSKFYGSSGFFDGTGDYLSCASSADFNFATSDFTIEGWFYATSLPAADKILIDLRGNGASTDGWVLFLNTSNQMQIYDQTLKTSSSAALSTSTWFHLAISRVSGTLTYYVNGASAGSFSYSAATNASSTGIRIGTRTDVTSFFFGYIQDFRIYKGVAKYTGNFNPPSATADPAIAAGNDSLIDSPTNYGTDTGVGGEVRGNYCTLNPLDKGTGAVLSNGNLDNITNTAGWVGGAKGTIGMSSGKWYFEVTCTAGDTMLGIGNAASGVATPSFPGYKPGSYGYYSPGTKFNNDVSSAYGASYGAGDVIGIAFDADNGTLTYYKNGTSQGVAFSSIPSDTYFPYVATYNSIYCNFGQRAFAYQTPGTNRPAATFKALCTQNLPAPLVTKSNTVMDVLLWSGTGGNRSLTGLNMSPDFVWIKQRNTSYSVGHQLYDVVRGAGSLKQLDSSNTTAEGGGNTHQYGYLSSFDSAGFSVTAGSLDSDYVNKSGITYVGWAWDAGTSTVSNTAGSITSQVRANATAGFSVVTYTGNAVSGATVGHGLGVAPNLIIIKSRSGTHDWIVYHASIGNTGAVRLNTTAATQTLSVWFNNSGPSSTTFTLGNTAGTNESGSTFVAYAFAPVVGYSSMGSYVGNGSATDGPFIYTGFKPRFFVFKRTDTTGQWIVVDTARSSYNPAILNLNLNLSDSEYSGYATEDFVSNGLKLRTSDANWNASGGTYVYFAFAESPFQYARAR
jgi:hypothetical protein